MFMVCGDQRLKSACRRNTLKERYAEEEKRAKRAAEEAVELVSVAVRLLRN